MRALPAIRETVPDVHYAIVGLPTLGDEIRRLAGELGVADRVHLLGRLDEARLVRLLNAADVFVMTSRHTQDGDFEGYGIAVIEAALCGIPAVVAGGSGLSEAVADGETGLCVAPEDPAATADAIRQAARGRRAARGNGRGRAAARRARADVGAPDAGLRFASCVTLIER